MLSALALADGRWEPTVAVTSEPAAAHRHRQPWRRAQKRPAAARSVHSPVQMPPPYSEADPATMSTVPSCLGVTQGRRRWAVGAGGGAADRAGSEWASAAAAGGRAACAPGQVSVCRPSIPPCSPLLVARCL